MAGRVNRFDVWWWRSLRVRSFAVTFVVAGLALALYSREYALWKLAAIVLPSAAIVGWWLGWRLVRPIERLRAQALEQVEALSPGSDLDLVRADEFGDLTAAFNRLLGELRGRARDKEAFVADLAHEFKNPVAAIRAAADALDSGPADALRLERLGRILGDSSRRLDALVTQFLELARAEAGLHADARTQLDLEVLAQARLERFSQDERFSHLSFSLNASSEDARMLGVESGLQTVIDNLLENAASFANTNVELQLHRDPALVVSVHDDGPGIEPEDRERVFERYFTRRASGKGTGLGLAMVRAVVRAHGGSVAALPGAHGGTSMRVQFPS